MRIILPFLFLLLQFQLASAQNLKQDTLKADTAAFSNEQSRRRRAPEPEKYELKMQNYSLKIKLGEMELDKLVETYSSASRSRKKILVQEIQTKIYELFDLDLMQKEEEASVLDLELKTLKADNTYLKKSEEIQTLQKALDEVRNSLTFRKENRDRFVGQRMKKTIDL